MYTSADSRFLLLLAKKQDIQECVTYDILISTSTPLGRLRFMRASTTRGFGSRISTRRLWVRISYCSCERFDTKVERFTEYFFVLVGSGTGPTTFALFRSAVSIMVLVAISIILLSYAQIFTRMRGPGVASFEAVSLVVIDKEQIDWTVFRSCSLPYCPRRRMNRTETPRPKGARSFESSVT